MQIYRSPLNPAHSATLLPLAVSQLAMTLLRNSRRACTRLASMRDWAPLCLAAGIMLLASGLCLSLTPPEKMIMPSSLMGGIHPTSMAMILTPARQ